MKSKPLTWTALGVLGLLMPAGVMAAGVTPAMMPLDLAGYNYDGIADPGYASPVGDTSGTLELYTDYVAKGFNPAQPNVGLPAGSTFVSAFHNTTTFAIQPAAGPNMLLLGPTVSPAPSKTGTLTLTAPQPVSEVAFLVTGFNGNRTGNYVLNYATGPADTGTFLAPDNFNGGQVALAGFGRYLFTSNIGFENIASDPKLFEWDVPADPTRALESITFINNNLTPGQTNPPTLGVFGVSAAAVPEPAAVSLLCGGSMALLARRRCR